MGDAEYKKALESFEKRYEGVKGADAKKELVAEFCGTRILTDYDFVRHLSTENRNVFQKVWDEVKYLCKMATAGSKEARELERVKRNFEKAYKESANVEGTKYNISNTQNMEWSEQISGLLNKQGQIKRSDTLVVEKSTPSYLQSDTTENLPLAIPLSVVTKARSGKDVSHSIKPKNIIKLQKGIRNAEMVIKNPDRNSFAFITDIKQDGHPVLVSFLKNADFDGDRVHKATSIHLQIDVNSMLEALPDTATIYFKNKKIFNDTVGVTNNLRSLAANIEYLDDILPQNSEKSSGKVDYSLSEDSNGNKLTKKQSEYFKDSKAVDEKGSLKVVYHGTRNADFTVFKRNVTYFTDSKEMADSYSPNGEMFEGYVNITKPYEIDAKGEKWSRIPVDNDTVDFLKEYGASVFKEGGKWCTTPADIASALEEAVDNGDMDYDGIIIKNVDDTGSYYKGKEEHLATDYIIFNSNQFKNVDNKKPTSNSDIRFSLSDNVEKTEKILYNKKTPLSVVNRAKTYNNSSLKWVYDAEIFSVTESKLFHSKISEINQGSEAFGKNSAGEYMIPIENKIVFTDGNYDSPYVREIVEVLTEYDDEFEKVRERIFNVEKGKSEKQDAVRVLEQMFGKGFIVTYRSGNDGVYDWQNGQRKGKTRSTVIRNHLNKQFRGRDDRKSKETQINKIAPVKEASSTDVDNIPLFIEKYVHYFNNERLSYKLNYKTPVQFRIEQGFG